MNFESQTVIASPLVPRLVDTASETPIAGASPFARAADDLIAAGYTPIPVMPIGLDADKAPGDYQGAIGSGRWSPAYRWNQYAHSKPSEASMERWKTWPAANVGIVLGTSVGADQIIALDFDTTDERELDLLRSQVPPSPMMKHGARGFTAFYRAGKHVRTKRYQVPAPTADKPAAKRTVLEILTGNAPRQTVVPPSRHSEGIDYRWITGDGIVPAANLPALADHHFEALEDTLGHLGWQADAARSLRAPANGDGDGPSIWRETNDAALANLDAWAGSLQLPKLRRHPNGAWEAVPVWRASGKNRPSNDRKPNLKIHSSGIKDMGTDIGYTPLDVVQAAFSWDFDNCFSWLRGKLGLNDDSGPLPERPRRVIEHNDGTLSDEDTGEVLPPPAPRRAADRQFPDALTRVPGLLGEMIDHIVATARRPDRVLALGSALVCLGTIIGRRDATPTLSGTHLYVIALAGTGAGKDHPQSAGKVLLRTAASEHPGVKLVGSPEQMSHTALVQEMEHRPLRCSFMDEFGVFLQKINGPRAMTHEKGIKSVLLTAWGRSFDILETPAWAAMPSKDIHSPAFSIFGASTQNPFYEALQGDDRENGFLNRMLLLPTFTKKEAVDPQYDYREVPPDLAEKLRAAYRVRRPLIDDYPLMHVVNWEGDDASAAWHAFKTECDEREDDASFYVRSAEMATRLATIRAVGRNIDDPVVSVEDIEWGIEVVRWSAHRMAEDAGALVADTQVGRDRARIMAKLNSAPGRSLPWSKVMKDLAFTSRDLKTLVADMVTMDQVVMREVRPEGRGRPASVLFAL